MSTTEEKLKKIINEDQEEVIENIEENIEEEVIDDFDIDAALEGTEPVDLAGKISDEDALAKAVERGYNPEGKDKYGHKISAIEFLERTTFFNKQKLMQKDIDRISKQAEKLARDNQKIAKKSIEDRNKLIADFKAEKEKLLSSDYLDQEAIDKVKKIDSDIESVSVDTVSDADQQMISDYDEAKLDFKKNNEWYENNRAMTILADKVGTDYANDYLNKYGELPPPNETFDYTLKEVKKDFPDLGKPPRQTRVNSPANRTVVQRQKPTGKTWEDLPKSVQEAAEMIIASTGDTKAEYLAKYNFDN